MSKIISIKNINANQKTVILTSVLIMSLDIFLTSCMPSFSQTTELEHRLNGVYQGHVISLLGAEPYRLVLSVQQNQGKASGVLTNLSNNKIYALNGEMTYSTTQDDGRLAKTNNIPKKEFNLASFFPFLEDASTKNNHDDKNTPIVLIKLKMYEEGNSHRGNLKATIENNVLSGNMSGLIFGHELYSLPVNLKKVKPINKQLTNR